MDVRCPNCQELYTTGIWKANQAYSTARVAILNRLRDTTLAAACNKCGDAVWSGIQAQLKEERTVVTIRLQKGLGAMPVLTLQQPFSWEYDVLGIVTGQSTTGTGVFSEFFSSFTDLFGTQSGTFNKKLRSGEVLCFAQLRRQALELGAHAVIGTDVDYSEVGGDKGMLMVCMSGTAIKLRNPSVLGPVESIVEALRMDANELKELSVE